MKTRIEIYQALIKLLKRDIFNEDDFSGMTYHEGIEEALQWVLEEIPDEEFEFSP